MQWKLPSPVLETKLEQIYKWKLKQKKKKGTVMQILAWHYQLHKGGQALKNDNKPREKKINKHTYTNIYISYFG